MLRDVNPNRCTDEQLPICVKGKFDFAVLDPSVCPDYGAQNVKDEIIDLSADQLAQLSQACEEELRLKCKNFKDVSRSIRRRQRVDVMQTDSEKTWHWRVHGDDSDISINISSHVTTLRALVLTSNCAGPSALQEGSLRRTYHHNHLGER
jgi:hypothetical protein